MKILVDNCLKPLAKKAGEKNEVYAEKLAKVIEDTELDWNCLDYESYGEHLCNSIDQHTTSVTEVIEMLQKTGIAEPSMEDIRNLMGVVIMGDGDCENCGGELEVVCTHYSRINGNLIARTTYRCSVCGEETEIEEYVD